MSQNYHSVEKVIEYKARPDSKAQFDTKQMDVFRAELAILMDASLKTTVAIIPIIDAPHTTPPFRLGEFVNQNEDYVVKQIAMRLSMSQKAVIRCLKQISAFIRNEDERDSMDATGQFSSNHARQYLPPIEVEPAPEPEPKKKGRKAKPRKDEKPTQHKGRSFKSIADAARSDPMTSYGTLRKAKYREGLRQASENSL